MSILLFCSKIKCYYTRTFVWILHFQLENRSQRLKQTQKLYKNIGQCLPINYIYIYMQQNDPTLFSSPFIQHKPSPIFSISIIDSLNISQTYVNIL